MFDDHFKETFGKIPIAIYQADCIALPASTEVSLHQHKEMELITLTEGSAIFFINGERFPLQKGDTLFIPPYALHRASVPPDIVTRYLCVCFDLELLHDDEIRSGLETGALTISPACQPLCPDGTNSRYAEYVSAAFEACRNNAAGWEFAAIGNILLLFSELKSKDCITPTSALETNNGFCMQVMEYIIINCSDPITSRSVADHLHMNNSYFCRLFRKHYGINFSLYLQTYRIEKAMSLLKYTKMPISAIVYKVGFSDFSYFSKIFKKDCGLTPSEYRKNSTRDIV